MRVDGPSPCLLRVAKEVALTLSPNIGNAEYVAQAALEAARNGAKVLIIRNLRRDAVATFDVLRAVAPDAPLFSCHGTQTLHHGRYAREDRPRLDAAVWRRELASIGEWRFARSAKMLSQICRMSLLRRRLSSPGKETPAGAHAGGRAPKRCSALLENPRDGCFVAFDFVGLSLS